jgi:hypothetical protein
MKSIVLLPFAVASMMVGSGKANHPFETMVRELSAGKSLPANEPAAVYFR